MTESQQSVAFITHTVSSRHSPDHFLTQQGLTEGSPAQLWFSAANVGSLAPYSPALLHPSLLLTCLPFSQNSSPCKRNMASSERAPPPIWWAKSFHSFVVVGTGKERLSALPSLPGPTAGRQEVGPALTAPLLCLRKQPLSATSCPRGFSSFPFRACWSSQPRPCPTQVREHREGRSF